MCWKILLYYLKASWCFSLTRPLVDLGEGPTLHPLPPPPFMGKNLNSWRGGGGWMSLYLDLRLEVASSKIEIEFCHWRLYFFLLQGGRLWRIFMPFKRTLWSLSVISWYVSNLHVIEISLCIYLVIVATIDFILHILLNYSRFQKPKILAALKAVETDINTMATLFG